MKKTILLTLVAAGMTLSAAAAPKRLASVLEVEHGMDLSDPVSVAMYTTFFHYDDQGRLYRVTEGNDCTTISYDDLSAGKLKLTYESSTYGVNDIYDVTLDAEGRAVAATCVSGSESKEYTFGYTDGRLTSIGETSTEYGYTTVGTTAITYLDGNISSVKYSEDNDPTEGFTCDFTYGGIDNVGSLRLFDELYGIDLSELEYLAQAGYMGLAPASLPTAMTLTDPDGKQSAKVVWVRDAEGYPTRLSDENSRDEYTEFNWESEPAGVDGITVEHDGEAKYFNLQGVRIDRPERGVYIVRYADGRSEKRVAR